MSILRYPTKVSHLKSNEVVVDEVLTINLGKMCTHKPIYKFLQKREASVFFKSIAGFNPTFWNRSCEILSSHVWEKFLSSHVLGEITFFLDYLK